ncbi:MAG: epoxyqueuosine reductase QueH [Solirubrobacterales bacterium]
MNVLLHVCCGPCATVPVRDLIAEGHQLSALYYNPNIHPFTEHERRREGAESMLRASDVPLIGVRPYDPVPYFQTVTFRENVRCRLCYAIRLEEAARIARKGKFDAFTSSLLISPYQKHDTIRETGEAAGEKYGVPFLYRDWRPRYPESVRISKEMGLYRQPYCGCLYSEWERYRGAAKNAGASGGNP